MSQWDVEADPVSQIVYAAHPSGVGVTAATMKPKAPTTAKKDFDNSNESWMPWGDNNTKPQEIVKLAEKSDVLPVALDIKAKACYGNGLQWGYKKTTENGEVLIPTYNKEVSKWVKSTNAMAYLREAFHDLFWFGNVYPELIYAKDKKNGIAQIYCQDAVTVRLGKLNKSGKKKDLINKAYISYKWEEGAVSEDDYKSVDVVDPYYNALGQAKAEKERFIYPLYSRMNGRVAYELPVWDGLIASRWLEVAENIPKVKLFRMQNNMSIAYHIEINVDYWNKYTGWKDKKPEEQKSIMETEVKAFLDKITGVDGKRVVMTHFAQAVNEKDPRSMWKVHEMKGTEVSDDMLEDSKECDFHIVRATGLHPSIVGTVAGKGAESGSGAAERVAWNNLILTLKPEQDRVLSPLNDIVVPINGWDKEDSEDKGEFCFWTRSYFIATKDTGKDINEEPS